MKNGFMKRIHVLVMAIVGLSGMTQAATTGFDQTSGGPHDYTNTANWASGVINGIWDTSLTLAAAQTVQLSTDTAPATGLTFNYSGSFALTLKAAAPAASQNFTLGGDIGVNTASASGSVTIGNTANHLNLNLGGVTRTMNVASGRTLTLLDVISNGGMNKDGAGTLALSAPSFTKAASATSGSVTLAMGDTSNIQTNMFISGTGIAGGCYITAIVPSVSVTLSTAATANTNNLTATLWNGNTYSGGTTVKAGNLKINGVSANSGSSIIGSPTGLGDVTFANGTTLDNSNGGNSWFAPTVTLQGSLNLSGGNRLSLTFKTLELGGGTRTLNVNSKWLIPTGGTTLGSETTGQCTWEMANTTAFGIPVVQNGTLDLETTAFSGSSNGAMRINNAMNWIAADLIIGSNVLLMAANTGTLGTNSVTSPNLALSGILDLVAKSVNVRSLSGSGTVFGSMLAANTTASTLTLNGATGSTTFSGSINNGPGPGALFLTKNGGSTQILSGVNSYSGNTTIVGGGTLAANSSFALGATTNVIFGNANAQGYAGILQLNIAPANILGISVGYYQNSGTLQLNYPNPALTLGALSLSQQNTLNITAGPNATGNPTVTFPATGNTFGAYNNAISSTLAPVGVTVTMGDITTVPLTGNNGPKINTLNLDGSGTGHQITGVISDSGVGTVTNFSPAAITKQNTSTWTLSGMNTYSGVTTINGGTLLVNGNSSAVTNAVTVNNNATLGGTGTLGGNVTLNAGGMLAPGGFSSVGTLTLTNSLTLKGNTLFFDLSTSIGVSDTVAVGGTLNNSGANTIVLGFPDGPALAGTYTLMTYAATNGSGTFAIISSSYYTYTNCTLNVTATNLQLVVAEGGASLTTSPALTWRGNLSSVWDTSTLNWKTNSLAAAYTEGDTVLFDDNAVGYTVNNSAAPGAVTFNNSANAYIVNAAIGGTGSFTKNGSAITALAGANTYAGDTTINDGTLTVGSGGTIRSPVATLNIAKGTNVLTAGGSIIVQSLLATNVVLGGANKSVLTFNGGTLTTSNDTGLAANILLPSNTSWTVNGTWNMNAGTHRVSSVQTNGTYNGVYIGNGSANAAVIVNPGSVWSLGTNPTVSNNNLTAYVGNSTGGNNNTLVVNNGLLTNAAPITLGNSTGNTGNGLVITNGGQVFIGVANGSGSVGVYIGNGSGSSSNYLRVEGANVANTKATLNMNASRINLGNNGSSGNWARIDQGGIITNVTLYSYGVSNAMAIINGGLLYGFVYCGRAAIGNTLIVTGADMAGNKASILSTGNVYVGGGGTSTSLGCGTNNLIQVGQDGFVRAATVYIGGAQSDTNSVANGLCVTNGGQFFLSGSAGITLGGAAGCNSNWVSVGGSPAPGTNALISLGGYVITIGGHIAATNNYMTLSSGGIFTNGTIMLGGASSRLYFDGGKLVARANGYPISTNAVATDAQILIKAGGAMIDSGAFTITNTLALLEDPASTNGGLTKLGSGKLVLLGNNSYSGSNVVAAGTLTLTGPFNANVGIQSGATLNGTGTLNVQVEDKVWDTVVVNGTLDISQMNLQIHTAGSLSIRDRIIVDYASGVQLGTSFASVTGLPARSKVIYDSVSKKIILSTFPRGTTLLFQ